MTDVSGKLGHEAHELTEEQFLAAYQVKDYPRPSVTLDIVVFTILDGMLKVLLIKRLGHPYQNRWALPGGFLDVGDAIHNQGEDLDEGACRELAEETHLPLGTSYIEQLQTFGKPHRDPRMRVISVAYFALVRSSLAPFVVAGDDAKEARWVPLEEAKGLAFDHDQILSVAVNRLRGKIDYAPIAFDLVPEAFTANDLREVYEVVKGTTYDSKNFYRRFRRMQADGVITRAPGSRSTGKKKAALFTFKKSVAAT